MKFSVDKKNIINKLLCLPGVYNDTKAILNTILIEATDKLTLTVQNRWFTQRIIVDAEIEETGKVCIPAHGFIKVLKEMPDTKISFALLEKSFKITADKVKLYTKFLDSTEYPVYTDKELDKVLEVDPKELKEVLDIVSTCQGVSVGFSTEGTNFEIKDGKYNVVATDGKRLSLYQTVDEPELGFVVPYAIVTQLDMALNYLTETLNVYFKGDDVLFETQSGDFLITGVCLKDKYPVYHNFIPQEANTKLTIKKDDLVPALKRASLLVDSGMLEDPIKLAIKDNLLTISKKKENFGEIEEQVEIDYSGEIVLGFNPVYLLDAVKLEKDNQLTIEINNVDSPVVVRNGNYLYLALPMLLDE